MKKDNIKDLINPEEIANYLLHGGKTIGDETLFDYMVFTTQMGALDSNKSNKAFIYNLAKSNIMLVHQLKEQVRDFKNMLRVIALATEEETIRYSLLNTLEETVEDAYNMVQENALHTEFYNMMKEEINKGKTKHNNDYDQKEKDN